MWKVISASQNRIGESSRVPECAIRGTYQAYVPECSEAGDDRNEQTGLLQPESEPVKEESATRNQNAFCLFLLIGRNARLE